MANHSLVIVESPAKAKTISKYLGPGFVVKASMGHLRDLPKSSLGVDLEHDFEPVYQPIKGKEETIRELQEAARDADMVYLATDPDREGEAISWHLKQLLGLPDDKTRRVTFNEITKKVVQDSIRRPRDIDQDLVDAQQARRILDRIVGYQLSPFLWKKVRRGLSAGRVQSVATRMVDDRDAEIEAFQPQEYWSLDVLLTGDTGPISARYHGRGGKKTELKSQEETDAVICEIQGTETADATPAAPVVFTVSTVKRTEKKRNPSPPFTTSTLQQEASRKLGMSPRRTMAVAQMLYEGIDIQGQGTVGLITYMRTDSLRISEEAQGAARTLITGRYGAEYCPGTPRVYKTKANAQDAHEAIRPSDVTLLPDTIKGSLTTDQYRLYRLIWSRFLASQMASATLDAVSVDLTAADHTFRTSASSMKFPGYTAVYEESRDEDADPESAAISPLASLKDGQTLLLQEFQKDQHFTQPPAHYTDATLIKAMEEQGIGRPSTYAPTVSTILDREYVVKEGKSLRITNLGRVVTGLMKERFSDVADLQFTASMEKELDSVEEGNRPWKDVLRSFYGDFDQHLQQAEKALEGIHLKIPPEISSEICPECGRNLVVKSGKFGRFLACPGYPDCTFTMPLVIVMPGRCPKCGGRMMKRTGTSRKSGKHYTFYCCEHHNSREEASRCEFMTWDIPTEEDCALCGQTLFKKAGRGRNKPFCVNPECPNFLPEDKRGYYKKKTEDAEPPAADSSGTAATEEAAVQSAEEPATNGKTTASAGGRKTAAGTARAKKTATTKKTATKTAAAKKTAATEKTTAAKRTRKTATAGAATAGEDAGTADPAPDTGTQPDAGAAPAKKTAARKTAKRAAGTAGTKRTAARKAAGQTVGVESADLQSDTPAG